MGDFSCQRPPKTTLIFFIYRKIPGTEQFRCEWPPVDYVNFSGGMLTPYLYLSWRTPGCEPLSLTDDKNLRKDTFFRCIMESSHLAAFSRRT